MGMVKVIVDTCFLEKISSNGHELDSISLILDELGYEPVAHPYVVKHEFVHGYLNKLVDSGYIHVYKYEDFLTSEEDEELYEQYFFLLYDDLRKHLEAQGGLKQIDPIDNITGFSIYNTRKAGSSMGDVHNVLMAAFLQLPIIVTEDSDIELLRVMAERRINLNGFELKILDSVALVEEIAAKTDSKITKKDLEQILKRIGERKHVSAMKNIWNDNHGI